MEATFVLYPNMTALDFVGPFEVLGSVPVITARFVAATLDPVKSDNGLSVVPTDTFDSLKSTDIVVVPGSGHWKELLRDSGGVVEWLQEVHPTTKWTTSVCTGSTLLAEAGLVSKATTHWAAREDLEVRGVEVSTDRVVFDGKVVSGAGVSAGIDMALRLVEAEFGEMVAQAVQVGIEYDPQPPRPYDSIPPEIAQGLKQAFDAIQV
ncbi:DJ-1/PfpI family protein [Lentzea sp. BCCO 10_0061]|uniref:DJ-1/PfpI family protein n=1 Tax=Lentzea sokolovensis TaxID=3095429 RepID=A0ABU4VBH7_9PSEU|nr:DJ-1/PfpI family protein [Lentzea sp. BCCO 10_0061]MDX8149158.1 DJ-1/PfpI family protein [Lentzea sp. BCCO 10_0061]